MLAEKAKVLKLQTELQDMQRKARGASLRMSLAKDPRSTFMNNCARPSSLIASTACLRASTGPT